MKRLEDLTEHQLRDLRSAVRDAIEAVAWYDLQVADVSGMKQADEQFSALSHGLRKLEAERKRRDRKQRVSVN